MKFRTNQTGLYFTRSASSLLYFKARNSVYGNSYWQDGSRGSTYILNNILNYPTRYIPLTKKQADDFLGYDLVTKFKDK
jgi:hypothetical protein